MTDKKEMEFVVSTAYDVFKFLLENIKDNFHSGKKNVAYVYINHLISPFFASKEDFKTIKQLAKHGKVNYVAKSDSPLDQILAGFYRNFNSKVKLGVDMEYDYDLVVVNGIIIKIYVPKSHRKEMDDLYFDTKSVLSFNMIKFFKEFAERKSKIRIYIKHDKAEAETYREHFKSKF